MTTRGTHIQGSFTCEEFAQLVANSVTGKHPSEEDVSLSHALRLYFSKHALYTCGYLLHELSRVIWLRKLKKPADEQSDKKEVFIEIDYIDEDLMDLTVRVIVPSHPWLWRPYKFDDRFTCRERAIYLILQPDDAELHGEATGNIMLKASTPARLRRHHAR